MTAKTVYDPADRKLPGLQDLRKMAAEAGIDEAHVHAILPPKTKPTKEAKRRLMVLVRDRLEDDPDTANAVGCEIVGSEVPSPAAGDERTVTSVDPVPSLDADALVSEVGEETTQLSRRRVTDLRPNEVNCTVFTTSLSAKGIEVLAEDIRQRGQRQPIEIMVDGTILDGERRWRAAEAGGLEYVDVVVREGVTPDDVAGFVVDSFSTVRDASVEEKVNVYHLVVEVLRARHGRPRGRPSKTAQLCAVSWEPKRIKNEAARRAGFGSARIAEYAIRIFGEADETTKAAVNAGDLAISAAYAAVTKVREPEVPKQEPQTETQDTDIPEATSAASDGPVAPAATAADSATESKAAPVTGGEPVAPDATTAVAPGKQQVDERAVHPGPSQQEDVDGDEDSEADDGVPEASTAPNLDDTAVEATDQPDAPEIDFDEAWARVLVAAEDEGAAVRMAKELLVAADVNHWVSPEEPDDYLSGLERLFEDGVEWIAEVDLDRATEWLRSTTENLGAIIDRYRAEDDAGGYED